MYMYHMCIYIYICRLYMLYQILNNTYIIYHILDLMYNILYIIIYIIYYILYYISYIY